MEMLAFVNAYGALATQSIVGTKTIPTFDNVIEV